MKKYDTEFQQIQVKNSNVVDTMKDQMKKIIQKMTSEMASLNQQLDQERSAKQQYKEFAENKNDEMAIIIQTNEENSQKFESSIGEMGKMEQII